MERYAGVLARHGERVVLVREWHVGWGGTYWNIPSGRVEDDETLEQGACRELAEETGLVVEASALVMVGTTSVDGPDVARKAWNFTVDVDDPTLGVRDPDGIIEEARWFPVGEAVGLLRELPYRPLSDPAVALLSGGEPSGTHWAFTVPEANPDVTRATR